MALAPNAALLIDFDNVTMGIRSDLQEQLRGMLDAEVFKGKISVQRAYADWRRYPQYIVPLSEASIDLIFAPAFGSNKKNATDIRLAIDALELVFTRPEIGTYILLSGDSDFSSLVLKLKEYGKYVVGVGIRESSSDLLIQNCDEYYSYSDLTGLLREGEVEHRRRDPWELAVEAATRMKQNKDVMRSDRLKQVMQELDPNFDEKDAGFSKYSRFLVEASRRGLLTLTKKENGQYEVDVGANANVPAEVQKQAEGAAAAAGKPRRRRGGRERSTSTRRSGMSLAEAFDLLRKSLETMGALGDEATDAEQTRERMIELADNGDDPILESVRFQRLLRQAHDAGVIDLVKTDAVYFLKLRPADETAVPEEPKKTTRSRRGTRGGRGRKKAESNAEDGETVEAAAPASADESPVPDSETKKPSTRKNPRYRRGSRGAPAKPKTPEPDPTPVAEVKTPATKTTGSGTRSVRGRTGRSRGTAGQTGRTEKVESPTAPPTHPVTPPEQSAAPPPAASEPVPAAPQTGGDEGKSLFQRMSAALQRVMPGPQDGEGGGNAE